MSRPRLILSLCDLTGHWPLYYRPPAYEVVCVDLQTGTDVLTYQPPRRPWGVLAAPPCTYFAVSGARWMNDPVRRPPEGLAEAVAVVRACLALAQTAEAWWALENPIGTLHTRHVPELGEPALRFDPCDYAGFAPDTTAEAYSKRTCLWGRFTPPARSPVPLAHPKGTSPIHRMPPGPERANLRSATPLGFAWAFRRANP